MSEPKYKTAVDDRGIWRVVDVETGLPPVIRGVPQAGLSHSEAIGIAHWLNDKSEEGIARRLASERAAALR